MTRQLTIAHLTAIDMAPPALIYAAAAAGFDGVGLRLQQVTPDTPGYPLTDRAAMQATRAALTATGIRVDDIEFFKLTPDFDHDAIAPLLDAGAMLGAKRVIAAPYDDDLNRLAETLAALSGATQARGMQTVLEFFPWTTVPDLATCIAVTEAAGPQIGILADSLHFDRSGSTLDQLAQVPASRLPFAHLCDARVQPPYTTEQLLDTARGKRLIPGQGQIDLRVFVDALPPETPLGLEIPGLVPPGADPVEHLIALRKATLALL